MSLKVKLFSSIAAFVLVLSMLFIGVYAAQNVELSVGGSVSFTASSVYAQITGSYVGTVEHPSTAQSLTQIDIDAETTDGAVSMPDDWTSMPLNFDSNGSDITVTITIENLASDRAIAVSLTDNTNITGVSVARAYNSASFEGNTSSQTIAGGQSGIFTFTLSVTSQNNDITGTFDLDISLTNSNTTAQTYTATITNTSGSTLYAMGDDGQIHTINTSGSLELQTSKVSFAIDSSYFSQKNSLSSKTLNNLTINHVDLFAVPEISSVYLYVNGEGGMNHGYICGPVAQQWAKWGSSTSYDSQVEISEDKYILTFTLTDDTELSFS